MPNTAGSGNTNNGGGGAAGNGSGNAGGAGSAGTGGTVGSAGSAGTVGSAGTLGGGGASGIAGSGGSAGQAGTAVCGNQLLESGEQCDDGNQLSLDGCDAKCGFEQSQRSNWFKVQFAPDAFCTANAFGSAFPDATRAPLQQSFDDRIANGAFSLLLAFGGLDDLSGAKDSAVALGVLYGNPSSAAGYDGKSDLDWWYAALGNTIDASRKPLSQLAGSITGNVLTTAAGKIQLPLLSTVPLTLSGTVIRLPLGATSKPLASTGNSPGHLSAEHLDPNLVSFASGGAQTALGAGELCGNISAASLNAEPAPAAYLVGGALPCNQGYPAGSSFLDLLVGGCTVGNTPVLTAVPPDQIDAAAAQPGAGGPYKLSANAMHVVGACRDKNNTLVTLATCLNAVAYSSAFKLTTDRVIIK